MIFWFSVLWINDGYLLIRMGNVGERGVDWEKVKFYYGFDKFEI